MRVLPGDPVDARLGRPLDMPPLRGGEFALVIAVAHACHRPDLEPGTGDTLHHWALVMGYGVGLRWVPSEWLLPLPSPGRRLDAAGTPGREPEGSPDAGNNGIKGPSL